MVRRKLLKYLALIQLFFLNILFYILKLIRFKREKNWVIGVSEIAKNIFHYGELLKPSYTVCLDVNPFYSTLKYDFRLSIKNKYIKSLIRIFLGPLLLAYLANKYDKFIYIWSTGFLIDREYEFNFLKAKHKKVICAFCGDDIRSLKLTIIRAKNIDEDTFAYYYKYQNPYLLSEKYDKEKKKIAEISDKYADLIFSAEYDQISYLKRKPIFFPYVYFLPPKNLSKFKELKKIRILHAPSNPIFKGTPLVRAAIKKLKLKGYIFEYIELENVSNDKVLEHLKNAHIVFNQFYSSVPGLFGIEAMAHSCAVLMSADPELETGLPKEPSDAWLKTKYWEVYDNLKYLLDNPEKIKYYAEQGYEYVLKNFSPNIVSEKLIKIFRENAILND